MRHSILLLFAIARSEIDGDSDQLQSTKPSALAWGAGPAFEEGRIGRAVKPNRALEWTSASWPRYAACIFSASRGQLAPAPQLQR
jgi:hypothetical protein